MTYRHPLCDAPGCTHRNPVKSYKLDPRNLHERYALLCPPCQKKLGYRPVDHSRPAVHATSSSNRARSDT